MSEEILINVTPQETRVAIVESGILQEVLIERTNKRGLVGNVFKAKVSRVLPGMQSAFIDIGLERTGFLQISDIVDTYEHIENEKLITNIQIPSIKAVLREGQDILVQVIKDPLGSKGARLTTRIAIPSRSLVYLPDHTMVAISQRIENQEERERLQQVIVSYHRMGVVKTVNSDVVVEPDLELSQTNLLKKGGFIIRTAAEGISEANLHKDIEFLYKLWDSTSGLSDKVSSPKLVYEDLPLALRTIRDQVHPDVERVRIDSSLTFDRAVEFASIFLPEFEERIEHYSGDRPIMELYSVEDEIQKSLNRKIQLNSGGHLVLDQTEAMTTIDVNTGAFVGNRTHEETIYKTNLESTQVICRQ